MKNTVFYKAFDKDFKCRGFQYAVGQTYSLPDGVEATVCGEGFHACPSPLSVWSYYGAADGTRYAEVHLTGVKQEGDKVAGRTITIVRELTLSELIVVAATSGNSANAATSGRYANAATSGDYANAATSGDYANAATSGYGAHAATSGNSAAAACAGQNGRAKCGPGGAIALAYATKTGQIKFATGHTGAGGKIKPGVWYTVKRGRLVEEK